ncbi:tRNA-dihydrouridine(20a/20b) synthase [NAD(P)+]-like [Macrosteles quadrilineatus]|uniref:tRNA-dihydrouridine(20a/20b) synthase [NAD(P)+]-like n=1 Tax=Macrosteles quadrilineatus TaxID=74068 RepID=UPI0023E11EF5|nr:tRNA-dihydrouridine(20a/20b) synthase [NAD(P)+]-like [Macrosteles quadrilineatus]XP_054275741.1 tRNA-dihydrouridine(20a/20b) synthase [NAD(P)+]-like [Macrosteles quadrilineatus]
MESSNSIVKLFEEKPMVKICAPMVRYSRLQFRSLVRKYECDLCFTPMIMADSFVKSSEARANDFKTNEGDRPLITQFGANNLEDFISAAQMVAPYCDGVDLNCGCPQRWAMKEGYGSALLYKPELVKEMVRQLREKIPKPFSISVKIRLLSELKKTVDLCKTLEACGVTFLTVHGRTPAQRTEPVNMEAFREIRQSVTIPLVANGDVKTLEDAEKLQQLTGYKGVMSARGMLQNPAMFAGFKQTPVSCIEDWLSLTLGEHLPFMIFHNHLVFMVEKILKKADRRVFNYLRTTPDVVKFLQEHLEVKVPTWYDPMSYQELTVDNKYKPDVPPNKLSIIDQPKSVLDGIDVLFNNSCKV